MNSIESGTNDDGLSQLRRSDRFQPYRAAHRRLRAALADALRQCSHLDAGDAAGLDRFTATLDELLALYAAHQHAEDAHLHAPLRAVAPRALLAFDSEHEDQLAHIASLRALLREFTSPTTDRERAARELELRFAQFMAEGLAHMADEETTLTRVLWLHFSDEQLRIFSAARDAATPFNQ